MKKDCIDPTGGFIISCFKTYYLRKFYNCEIKVLNQTFSHFKAKLFYGCAFRGLGFLFHDIELL